MKTRITEKILSQKVELLNAASKQTYKVRYCNGSAQLVLSLPHGNIGVSTPGSKSEIANYIDSCVLAVALYEENGREKNV